MKTNSYYSEITEKELNLAYFQMCYNTTNMYQQKYPTRSVE